MVMDTICDATQERQDAVHELVDEGAGAGAPPPPDMMLVVGGFNSSNTSHLQEIPEAAGVPSFWVDGARCVDVAANTITHKLANGEMVTTKDWLPPASTPIRPSPPASRITEPTGFAGLMSTACTPPAWTVVTAGSVWDWRGAARSNRERLEMMARRMDMGLVFSKRSKPL